MSGVFYKFISWLAKTPFFWLVYIFTWFVTTGFFLFKRSRVKSSTEFYEALFPNQSWLSYQVLAWRQFHHFSTVFIDRLRFEYRGDIDFSVEGLEIFEQTMESGSGAMLLMTHFGNWEIAARALQKEGLDLMLFMGEKQKEQIEKKQKKDLQADGVSVAVNNDGQSMFDGIEGLSRLREGGIISMAGDLVWSDNPQTVKVDFLGHEKELPVTPHLFVLIAKVPVITPFFIRESSGRYHVKVAESRYVVAETRKDRQKALQNSAQNYANDVIEMLKKYPEHWYHFEPFLSEKKDSSSPV